MEQTGPWSLRKRGARRAYAIRRGAENRHRALGLEGGVGWGVTYSHAGVTDTKDSYFFFIPVREGGFKRFQTTFQSQATPQ